MLPDQLSSMSTESFIAILFVAPVGYKIVSTLVDNWLKKTNEDYITKTQCAKYRASCDVHKNLTLRKISYQINQLRQIMFKIGLKVGLDEDELNTLVSMNGDSDEKIK